MPRVVHQHPLALPNIVSNIFQYFSETSFLESLRLVCHCWNQEACVLLRRYKLVKFNTETSVEDYIKIFENSYDIFGTFPHAQYQFTLRCDHNVLVPEILLPESLQLFFNIFGEFITNIHVPVRRGTFDLASLNFILGKVPNLTTLGLTVYYYHDEVPTNYELSEDAVLTLRAVRTLIVQVEGFEMSEDATTSLLSLLFGYMPNLQKISYPGDIRRISQVGLLLRDIILGCESASNLKRLAEWEFKTRLLETEALKFLCKEFPMKTLHVDLWNPEDDFNCISSELMAGLIRKWSESLEKLTVEFPWRKELSFHFNFPVPIKNLTFLYLGGFEGSLIELLKQLPSLKNLELSQLDLNSILQKPGEEKYLSVKELRLDFCTGQSGGILSRFSRIFPQLQNLNINHTTNETARVIFQKMSSLVSLRMQGNDLTDAGICGFSEATLKEKDFMALSPTQGNHYRKYPFIADLKELQYLKLDAYAITEITVRHALVHCTSLRLVKWDSTGSGSSYDESTFVCRTFRLSEYEKHLVEEKQGTGALVEMKEEPPLDREACEFFLSHNNLTDDLVNLKPY